MPSLWVGHRSATWPEVLWHGTAAVTQADHAPFPVAALASALLSVLFYLLFGFSLLFFFFYFFFILHYFTFLFCFLISLLTTYPSPSFFVCFCLIPIVPLDHQPGSHLLQCHYFLSQPRGLHTKLPICTLPALSGVHGCGGPAEHAPADRNSADLCPARPLPASSHRLPTRLPR